MGCLFTYRSKRKTVWLLAYLVTSMVVFVGCKKVTIVVNQLPPGTNERDRIFIAGNFNYWDPGDAQYMLDYNGKGTHAITLPLGWGKTEYKFTRGDWTTVETDACGGYKPNRELWFGRLINDTVYTQIISWKDLGMRLCNKVRLVVKPLHPIPDSCSIYLAGNFNNWAERDPKYRLTKRKDGKYQIILNKSTPTVEFKFTRGSWLTEELNEYGNIIENRVFSFGNADSLQFSVPFWKDEVKIGGNQLHVLVKVPENTPDRQQVYVAGNFNNWNAANPAFRLKKVGNKLYAGTIPIFGKEVRPTEFKFTRGSWASVESDPKGLNLANRSVNHGLLGDTVLLEVIAWKDIIKG